VFAVDDGGKDFLGRLRPFYTSRSCSRRSISAPAVDRDMIEKRLDTGHMVDGLVDECRTLQYRSELNGRRKSRFARWPREWIALVTTESSTYRCWDYRDGGVDRIKTSSCD
jgi:hypothetical protein